MLVTAKISFSSDETVKVVFCDIGQGDAIYIRINDDIDMLIDAGQGRAVLNCLGKYMPFYDRDIELAFITHPQQDHYGGFEYVIGRYKIGAFVFPPVLNPNHSFEQLVKTIKEKGISVRYLYQDDVVNIAQFAKLSYLWPTQDYLSERTVADTSSPTLAGVVLGTTTDNLNNFSQVMLFSYDDFDVMLTGDSTPTILDKLANELEFPDNIEVLKVPHHGSKKGLTSKFLSAVNPKLAVISVGEKNRFGHPHKATLDMLEKAGVKYLLTSKLGDVVIDVDSSGWSIR